MFQFSGFPFLTERRMFRRTCNEKSHSGFLGSKVACAYPRRIAVGRALRRRLKPSHPSDGVACQAYLLFGFFGVCLTFEDDVVGYLDGVCMVFIVSVLEAHSTLHP
jgi:hypothetical protein